MSKRATIGRGLFYTRDSEGHSELAPQRYVEWARGEAAKLGVTFTGTPTAIESMIARGVSAEGDLFIDYGISGNEMSRPGLDAFRQRALHDLSVSHILVPRRDRIARPDNPIDAMLIEYELRASGLTLVLMNGPSRPPIPRGQRIDIADLITSMLEYESSGQFRLDLAQKLIHAKIMLAKTGFSIGGEPPYGFRRWLCAMDGTRKRELAEHEIVKRPGHHVLWLPTSEGELKVVRRILDLIERVPASRIARLFNDEKIPSPKAGRTRTVVGIPMPVSGLWSQNTIKAIACHPILIAVMRYNYRSEGDQMRFTPQGPRLLGEGDYNRNNKPKQVMNTSENIVLTPAKSEAVTTPEQHERIRTVLEARGKSQRGKPRAHGDAPNPLGARIFDLNCGWPMYRYARRGQWCYGCGLYQNSEARGCRHNVVSGLKATRFVLGSLHQRLLNPTTMSKLKARLQELASAELGQADPVEEQRNADQRQLAALKKKHQVVGRNMALAESIEERAATASVFRELTSEISRLETKLNETRPAPRSSAPEQAVEAALALLDGLMKLAETNDSNYGRIGDLIEMTNARLFLKFREIKTGRRSQSVPAGGVLTFGSTPPPGPLYEGPTHRVIIRKMLASGESVTAGPEQGASDMSDSGQDVGWSANVKRSTRRCT